MEWKLRKEESLKDTVKDSIRMFLGSNVGGFDQSWGMG